MNLKDCQTYREVVKWFWSRGHPYGRAVHLANAYALIVRPLEGEFLLRMERRLRAKVSAQKKDKGEL